MKTDSVITQHPNIIHADEKSITFKIEHLTPPKDLLPETSKAEVLKAFSNFEVFAFLLIVNNLKVLIFIYEDLRIT